MRISSVSSYQTQGAQNHSKKNAVQKGQIADISKPLVLTFSGKNINLNQIASITPENMGLGLPEAHQGGEGNVGFEMIQSFRKHEGVDARNFMPIWQHNNPEGGYKLVVVRETDYPNGFENSEALKKGLLPAKDFINAPLGMTLEDVAKKEGLKPSELRYVVQSKPDAKGMSKFCLLEKTSVEFKIRRPDERFFGDIREIPFSIFKVSKHNPDYNKIKGEPHYFYYTPDLAKACKPYSYNALGESPFDAEIISSDGMRGLTKAIHSKMDTEEFGHFKPGNVILHDRAAHPYANFVTSMSAKGDTSVNGIKYHLVEHNPGRNYQGYTNDPFKFIPIVADAEDVEAFKKTKDASVIIKAQFIGVENLTKEEQQIFHTAIDPALAPYKDGAGTYNIIKTGLASAKNNPENITVGTVSRSYGKEMASKDTYDTAKYLTDDFAQLKTINIVNGSTPASMKFDDPDALFGRDNTNGLYKERAGFKTFKYNGDINEIVEARKNNAKWLSNLIWEAGEKGQDELNKLFFAESQIKSGCKVHGHIKPVQEGDMILISWGRPVEQKAYTITTGGLLKYLKNPNIPESEKQKVRVIIGAGTWNEHDPEFKNIMHDLKEIEELNNGAYKNCAMLVDGWFSNRLVGCAQYGIFTPRREMCGITPLEAKVAGVPSAVTKTGGPADYTTTKNGFLTKNCVEENPDKFGLSWNNTAEEIDQARIKRSSSETAEMIDSMVKEYTYDYKTYVEKCKLNIEEKVDWHENAEYNNGKSANRRYLEDVFGINEPVKNRNHNPLKRVFPGFGHVQDQVDTLAEKMAKTSKAFKILAGTLSGVAVIGGGIFALKSKNSNKHNERQLDKVS